LNYARKRCGRYWQD